MPVSPKQPTSRPSMAQTTSPIVRHGRQPPQCTMTLYPMLPCTMTGRFASGLSSWGAHGHRHPTVHLFVPDPKSAPQPAAGTTAMCSRYGKDAAAQRDPGAKTRGSVDTPLGASELLPCADGDRRCGNVALAAKRPGAHTAQYWTVTPRVAMSTADLNATSEPGITPVGMMNGPLLDHSK